ncbi:FtsX-like permease family protein [Acutalibacter caecimuris]|uniref:FtsX-like permease family protein n=1 Tax=Acutalibacter caecimuris TaxID=3093657 RepID=UPI002AC9F0AB|nr:FtsX-like permease family protein [Acutalibacter sp. M00118]
MFSFSIKQLLRQPWKALLFFLLMAASTALVVTGAVLTVENHVRIQIVEDTYATVGYIEQMPVSNDKVHVPNPCMETSSAQKTGYGGYIHPEDLDFPGANYVVKPESRPYYVFHEPSFSHYGYDDTFHVVEFSPFAAVGEDGAPVEVEVTKVLFSKDNQSQGTCTTPDLALHEGDRITVCQCWGETRYPMEPGEKYVAELAKRWNCPEHQVDEYVVYSRPHTGRTDREGNYIGQENFPDDIDWGNESPVYPQIAQVTGAGFYEKGNPGYVFAQWAKNVEQRTHCFCALATNALEVLPSWHEKNIVLLDGREITQEEFASGAPVCMVSLDFARRNRLTVGSKVNMPFVCAMYRDLSSLGGIPHAAFSLLDEDGAFYEPFFEQEYEIVGLVGCQKQYEIEAGQDTFIIPAKSVTAGDESHITYCRPMTRYTASFQIPNGSIQQFDAALKAHVPQAQRLQITYDDRGYSEIRKSLDNSRAMAFLLLMGGIMAALSIMALLLYFFVVKEKKRTAIERSLGMTKRQCRASLLLALMMLTVLSASVGGVCGTLALDKVSGLQVVAATPEERDSLYDYDTRYSTWAAGRELAEKAQIEVDVPEYVSYAVPLCISFAVPLCISFLTLVLALLLMALGFRTDPIYLLSTREKE